MLYKDKIISFEAELFCFGNQAIDNGFIQLPFAGQNPQVVPVGTANQRVAIMVLVEVGDVVARVERPEEGYFQRG